MSRPITYGLEPFRRVPGEVVNVLPKRRFKGSLLGHAIAVVIGATAAILLLAIQGAQ